jgi:chaperonin GroES
MARGAEGNGPRNGRRGRIDSGRRFERQSVVGTRKRRAEEKETERRALDSTPSSPSSRLHAHAHAIAHPPNTHPQISTVTPMGDRVLVKAVVEEARTSSGIFLPSTSATKPNQGQIVSAGSSIESVKVGDTVVYSSYAGTEVDMGGMPHIILKNDDLVGTLGSGSDVSKMTPLQDRVLIRVDEVSDTSSGGLLLTDSAKEEPTIGEVVAVGPGVTNGDEVKKVESVVGSKVMYQKFSGSEYEGADGKQYIVVRDGDIIATVA